MYIQAGYVGSHEFAKRGKLEFEDFQDFLGKATFGVAANILRQLEIEPTKENISEFMREIQKRKDDPAFDPLKASLEKQYG